VLIHCKCAPGGWYTILRHPRSPLRQWQRPPETQSSDVSGHQKCPQLKQGRQSTMLD